MAGVGRIQSSEKPLAVRESSIVSQRVQSLLATTNYGSFYVYASTFYDMEV